MRTCLLLVSATLVAACGGGADGAPPRDPSSAATPESATVPADVTPTPLLAPTAPDGVPAPAAPAAAAHPATPASPQIPAATTVVPAPTPYATSTPPPASPQGVRIFEGAGTHDPTKSVDDTGRNARDRSDTLTPVNQGNGRDELRITSSIRRGLMGDATLSFDAKNVKVITVGSKVTLRGPVASDREKAAIEARAAATPGVTDVDDQIEVRR